MSHPTHSWADGLQGGRAASISDAGAVARTLARCRMPITSSWLPWALGSAVFAALTAIFAKVGLEGIDSDFATLLRTFVIVAVLGAFVAATGKWRSPAAL